MLVGLAAGLLVFVFAKVFGEPQVDKAIAFEEATARRRARRRWSAAACSRRSAC